MAKTRRTFTPEFKAEAVRRIADQGKSLSEVARELDLGESMLRSWKQALAAEGEEDSTHAITDYRTLDAAGRKLTWLELSPLTGRTHQLRVHCAALGTPIVGDRKYGGEAGQVEGLAAKLHLHARRLVLPHPLGGTLELEADLPAHMQETFKALGFEAPRSKKAVLF